jgi:hypothetical protein
MKISNDNLKAFFAQMREEDEQILIPEFEQLKKKIPSSGRRYSIQIGVAASILLFLSLYFGLTTRTDEQQYPELVIIISGKEEMNTRSLLEEDITIDTWESHTAFLINDFNLR